MHVLAIRFSSIGDVALCLPVLKSLLALNSDLKISFLSHQRFQFLFENIERLHFVGIDTNQYRSFAQLNQLYKTVNNLSEFDAVIDLHNVLRSQFLTIRFKLSGKKVFSIDKGRKEKRALTRKKNRLKKQLTHTVDRYFVSFNHLNLQTDLIKGPWYIPPAENIEKARHILSEFGSKKIIGFAPFAKHETKIWPLEYGKELLIEFTEKQGYHVLIFGGKEEQSGINNLVEGISAATSLVDKYDFTTELAILGQLEFLISMDSANMHLASLVGTKVYSIWGATHPYAGFSPLENEYNIIQLSDEELNCRPCSVYGNKPCWRGDFACMQRLTPNRVLDQLL